ncbi:hypothetical protein FRN31_22165 [Vibrio alginolyticus]|nr:hypothetical protein [Vibrio alginolyticus]
MISSRFKSIDDIPIEISEFYFEVPIESGVSDELIEGVNPETGESYDSIVSNPTFEMVVTKQPAYYENGGHISSSTVSAWNFHDAFIEYLDKLEEAELYNSTPQYDADGEPLEVEPVPLPPKPKREDF